MLSSKRGAVVHYYILSEKDTSLYVKVQRPDAVTVTSVKPSPVKHLRNAFMWHVKLITDVGMGKCRYACVDEHASTSGEKYDHLIYETEQTEFARHCIDPTDGVVLKHENLYSWMVQMVVCLGFEEYMAKRCASFWTSELSGAAYVYARVIVGHEFLDKHVSLITLLDHRERKITFGFCRIGFVFKKVDHPGEFPRLGSKSTQYSDIMSLSARTFDQCDCEQTDNRVNLLELSGQIF